MQCSVCQKSYCGTCITPGEVAEGMKSLCPNVQCKGAATVMKNISSIAKNFLYDLKLKCKHCDETPSYDNYDAHQLKHHHCQFCSKSLPNWEAVRKHYYEECFSFIIECDKCEFVFSRQNYYNHDCSGNYTYRQLELMCVIMCALLQFICLGLFKTFHLSECGLTGGILSFI